MWWAFPQTPKLCIPIISPQQSILLGNSLEVYSKGAHVLLLAIGRWLCTQVSSFYMLFLSSSFPTHTWGIMCSKQLNPKCSLGKRRVLVHLSHIPAPEVGKYDSLSPGESLLISPGKSKPLFPPSSYRETSNIRIDQLNFWSNLFGR